MLRNCSHVIFKHDHANECLHTYQMYRLHSAHRQHLQSDLCSVLTFHLLPTKIQQSSVITKISATATAIRHASVAAI